MNANTCIWCLGDASDADVEHVFPAALGCPPELVLPGTVVCKNCNNGLAVLDQAVADEFDFVALMSGVPRKGGRPAELLNRGNVHGHRLSTGPELFFNLDPQAVVTTSGRRLAGYRGRPRDIHPAFTPVGAQTRVEFDVPFGQSKNFIRGVFKIALNSVAYLLGAQQAADETFQGVRDFVRRRVGSRHLIVSNAEDKNFSLAAQAPWRGEDGTYAIELRIATAQFLLDLSNDERHYPVFRRKALEIYGETGWTTLSTEV